MKPATEPFGVPPDGDPTPQAIEAEQGVIAALLPHNDAVDLMGELPAAQFYRHDHRLIFTGLRRQIGAGEDCDVISGGMALNGMVPDAMAHLNAMAQSCPARPTLAATPTWCAIAPCAAPC